MSDWHGWAAVAVFAGAYVRITSERVHRTAAALGGAACMLAIDATDDRAAFCSEHTGIDWSVVFLLLGMMAVVGVLRQTGLFAYLAIWSVKRARGRPFRMMAMPVLITAAASARHAALVSSVLRDGGQAMLEEFRLELVKRALCLVHVPLDGHLLLSEFREEVRVGGRRDAVLQIVEPPAGAFKLSAALVHQAFQILTVRHGDLLCALSARCARSPRRPEPQRSCGGSTPDRETVHRHPPTPGAWPTASLALEVQGRVVDTRPAVLERLLRRVDFLLIVVHQLLRRIHLPPQLSQLARIRVWLARESAQLGGHAVKKPCVLPQLVLGLPDNSLQSTAIPHGHGESPLILVDRALFAGSRGRGPRHPTGRAVSLGRAHIHLNSMRPRERESRHGSGSPAARGWSRRPRAKPSRTAGRRRPDRRRPCRSAQDTRSDEAADCAVLFP
ncbi:SLC13 family permease [Streptomyces sp. WELS2]|uniref:SLC13 family permease n=1 Tax=Streptomyces sp. WELS2 TaxID=2749435 RepID=UPI0015F03242|nr:SLC13 family permease [Streptomyces sp. WELS2]